MEDPTPARLHPSLAARSCLEQGSLAVVVVVRNHPVFPRSVRDTVVAISISVAIRRYPQGQRFCRGIAPVSYKSRPDPIFVRDVNHLGVSWRVYHDYGSALGDPKAGAKSDGE